MNRYWRMFQDNVPRYLERLRRSLVMLSAEIVSAVRARIASGKLQSDQLQTGYAANGHHGLGANAIWSKFLEMSKILGSVIGAILLYALADFRRRNRTQQVGILCFSVLAFLVLLDFFSSPAITAPQIAPGYNPAGPPSIYITATPAQQRNCGRSNVMNRALNISNLFLANSTASGIAGMFPAFGSEMVTKAVAVTNSRFDPQITSGSFKFSSNAPHSDVVSVGPNTSDVGKFNDFRYIMMACQADLTIQITSRQNGGAEHTTVGTNPILILIPATGYRGDQQITLFGVSSAQTATEENIGANDN